MSSPRQDFIDRFKHELCGIIADAATNKATGGPLAILLRDWFRRADTVLGQAYDHLTYIQKGTNVQTNGAKPSTTPGARPGATGNVPAVPNTGRNAG